MRRPPYLNHISMQHGGKGIPYGGSGILREDGDANYGFKDLKSKPELLVSIPELSRDRALMDLVCAINLEETGLFSVGCVSDQTKDESGFRDSGYVEICINSASAISDARSYFTLWFHFENLLHQSAFNARVAFDWELELATFYEIDVTGFTCSIFVNTDYSKTKEEADANWSAALAILAKFLSSVPQARTDQLFRPPSPSQRGADPLKSPPPLN